jgi:hypothetical protein
MSEDECGSLYARINALEKMLNEREERTKERFVFIEKNINIAMASADKAITKSEMAVEKRFDSVNEFRASLADQAATLMPRAEYSVQHATVVDRLAEVSNRVSTLEDKGLGRKEASAGIGSSITFTLGIIGSAVWITTMIFGAILYLHR